MDVILYYFSLLPISQWEEPAISNRSLHSIKINTVNFYFVLFINASLSFLQMSHSFAGNEHYELRARILCKAAKFISCRCQLVIDSS